MIMASISSACANPGSVRAIYWQPLVFFAMPSDVAVKFAYLRPVACRCNKPCRDRQNREL